MTVEYGGVSACFRLYASACKRRVCACHLAYRNPLRQLPERQWRSAEIRLSVLIADKPRQADRIAQVAEDLPFSHQTVEADGYRVFGLCKRFRHCDASLIYAGAIVRPHACFRRFRQVFKYCTVSDQIPLQCRSVKRHGFQNGARLIVTVRCTVKK